MFKDITELAKLIDHTNLKPYATTSEIKNLCEEAIKYNFQSICINPYYLDISNKILKESTVNLCTVIGFPLGANTTKGKVFEAKEALDNGVDEIDLVINIGALKGKEYQLVKDDILSIIAVTPRVIHKVIIETCFLTRAEKIKACEIILECQAEFVKTSTGFGTQGATEEDVKLIRQTVGNKAGVKAAGGIKDLKTVKKMVKAGATRIGTSNGVAIVEEYLSR